MYLLALAIWIALLALVVLLKIKMPAWKGKYSENLVTGEISELSSEYMVFNDLLFESNGRSTQIDHVVVSPYGVFVIETKGYKGWIFGSEDSEYWTQTIYKSKHQFYNPIKQNEGHVRFLRYLLKNAIEIPFVPIVVFNNAAELKVNVENSIVINRRYLKESILQHKTPVLKEELVNWIVATINRSSKPSTKDLRKQHRTNVWAQ
ncbi:MAG: nuclease-related domain-containing protein [Sodaliphilus sp.]|nr:nuclease-related domain-containing protein [Sodaliphilus sp.]